MADLVTERTAEDGFARYYAEKLWNWIPEVYRDADFTSPRGEVLRPLVEIIAGEAAVARRAIDRLWEDVLIDYADEWAIPYIGELIGARLLNSVNTRGMRADVANTIEMRRKAGTLPALQELIGDITGWHGVVVESWKRLGRHWHGLDDGPYPNRAMHGSMATGGFANLRLLRICDARDTAFDGFAHRPDFRRLRGTRGRYSIPRLNIHLFRRHAVTISDSMGFQIATELFTFDPSGREVALFAGVSPPASGQFVQPSPWHMPMPISASMLDHALFRITASTNLASMGPRMPALVGTTIEGQRQLAELARLDVGGPPNYPNAGPFRTLQNSTHDPECGKYQLYGRVVEVKSGTSFGSLSDRTTEEVAAANLPANRPVPDFPPGVRALIDPKRGLVRLKAGEDFFRPRLYNYGCFAPVGAGGHERKVKLDPLALLAKQTLNSLAPIALAAADVAEKMRFLDSFSWKFDIAVPAFGQLMWKAANRTRPYVLLKPGVAADTAVLASKAPDTTKPADDPVNRREIDIDGLWLAVNQASYPEQTLPSPDGLPTPVMTTIEIDGTAAPIHRVTLRNVTLDPGGERARVQPCKAVAIPYVRLLLKGEVAELVIENCITGPIEEFAAASDPCSAGEVIIRDSIVQSIDPARAAINLKSAKLTIERSTVFGAINANQLYASELLVTGAVVIADNQHGCFRFSAAGADPAMRLPRQFESHRVAGGIAPHMFVSQRFGDAGYAQLSETSPAEIHTGAENGSEIGVFSNVLAPIKLADLSTKLDEYAPFNTISGFIFES